MKKILTLLVGLFTLLSMAAAQDWNISSASFSELGKLETTITVEGLTLHASTSGSLDVDQNNKSEGGINYTHRLKFGGTGVFNSDGTPNYRVVSFPVTGPTAITIKCMSSSGTADRHLNVKTASGTLLAQVPAPGSTLTATTVTYMGGPDVIYLYSPSSGVNVYHIKAVSLGTLVVAETFPNRHTTTLPDGWSTGQYYAGVTTNGTNATASAFVDTIAQVLKVDGSGGGNRGIGINIPSSGDAQMVTLDFKWFTNNPGTEANKLVDLNFTDASGNSILYFYAENWQGATNHFHCLNLDPTVVPSGANKDKPLVAIAANKNTLFGQSETAYNFGVNVNWYHIQARIDFVSKRIVELTVTSGGESVTVKDLPFISTAATSLSKFSCATYRNANANNDGTGDASNGANAYLTYQFDDFTVMAISPADREAYMKSYFSEKLEQEVAWAELLAAGTTPEAGILGYQAGAKSTFSSAVLAAKTVWTNPASTSAELETALAELKAAIEAFDAAKLPVNDEIYLSIGSDYLKAGLDAATLVANKAEATVWEVTTDPHGCLVLQSDGKYLGTNGQLVTTPTAYKLVVDGTTFKLNIPDTKDFVLAAEASVFGYTIASDLVYFVNETFSAKSIELPEGWGYTKYSTMWNRAMSGSNHFNAVVDTTEGKQYLIISGNGGGDRASAFSFPSSGTETLVDFQFDWFTGNPGSEGNKMVEMDLTDDAGNSVLYFYIENWTGATNHIHLLNLDPTVNPGGSDRYAPDVAIAANQTTLFPGKSFEVNTHWYTVKARLDFVNKRVVSLSISANGDTATVTDLPFISSAAANISRFNCVTYRNAAVHEPGTGGNGANAYIDLRFDNVMGSVVKSKDKEAYFKSYNTQLLGETLAWNAILSAGTTPESGVLGYRAGAKAAYTSALNAAKAVYENELATSGQLLEAKQSLDAALAAFDAAKLPLAADFLLNNAGKFLISTDTTVNYADTVALGSANAQKASTLWTTTTDENGYVTFMNGVNYLQPDGLLGATPVSYRFVVNGETFKLNKVGTQDFLTIGTDSTFSLFTLTIPIKPIVLSTSPEGTAVDTTGAVVKVTYNQNIAIAVANGIKVNGAVVPAQVVGGKELVLDVDLAIKTDYEVTIDSAAIEHADDATLVADALAFTFRTYSPYLRDKQAMLGEGAFDGVYALFGQGNANGYMALERQIAADADGNLWCGLSNALTSQWALILADTTNLVWNVKNHVTDKYLAWGEDNSLILSESAVGWQISLNASAPSDNDWTNVYTFWPAVDDQSPLYNMALRVDSMRLEETVAGGNVTTAEFRVCPVESITYKEPQNFSFDSFLKIGARNAGSDVAWQKLGDNAVYFSASPESVTGSYWKVTRQENGRYTFQNALTGQYLTYINDSTVQTTATYTPGSDDQEWVIMFHCLQSNVTEHYTIQGRKNALYGGSVNGGYLSVTARNAGNDSGKAGGTARIKFTNSGTTYIIGVGKPTIYLSEATVTSLELEWTRNIEAERYIVWMADTVYYMNGDSIGYNEETGDTIYAQVPYLVDSICISIDTVTTSVYRAANLDMESTYYIKVQAMDKNGNLGLMSDVFTATTLPFSGQTIDVAPIISDVTNTSMTVSWTAVEGAATYNLYMANAKTGLINATPISVTGTTKVVENLVANRPYFVQIAAVDAAGTISQRSPIAETATKTNDALNVAYITYQKAMDATAAPVQNDPIYRMLNSERNLMVTLHVLTDADITATATFDQSPYDVLVVQESLGGGAAILTPGAALGLSNLTVPTLYNKTYAFKSGRAFASGGSATGAEATENVFTLTVDAANMTHPLFNGITFDENNAVLMFTESANDLGATGNKALNVANNVAGVEGTLLAYPTGMTPSVCVNDIPAGATIGDQLIKTRIITFGMNFGALCRLDGANITPANYTLWKNAVNVLGRDLVGLETSSVASLSVYPNPTTDVVNLSGLSDKATVKLFSLTGQLMSVQTAEGNQMSLNMTHFDAGVYLLEVESTGSKQTIKLIKR